MSADIAHTPSVYPCPTVQRWGIRGTNFHDYWDCERCKSKWFDGPPKKCGAIGQPTSAFPLARGSRRRPHA